MLADTHCHLNFDSFDEDREAVIERARQAGVERILNPGIDVASSRAAVALADRFPVVYAAVGVHPNDLTGWSDGTLDELRSLAGHRKVVAIGEIGLDYYRDRAPHDLQQRVFREQLALAADLDLPAVIHIRNASGIQRQAVQDTLGILKKWQAELAGKDAILAQNPGVLHSYSGNEREARQAIDLNFYLGFTGPVTFRNAPEVQQLVAGLPLDSMLIETDAPFLTPHPFRGKRNEPARVRLVAEKIAELHRLPLEIVAASSTSNAQRLFHW